MIPTLKQFQGAMTMLLSNPSIDEKEVCKAIIVAYNTKQDTAPQDIETIDKYLSENK
ncbi:MAG: hypothetical protein WAT79_08385 [Saprospiraceae bacterium]